MFVGDSRQLAEKWRQNRIEPGNDQDFELINRLQRSRREFHRADLHHFPKLTRPAPFMLQGAFPRCEFEVENHRAGLFLSHQFRLRQASRDSFIFLLNLYEMAFPGKQWIQMDDKPRATLAQEQQPTVADSARIETAAAAALVAASSHLIGTDDPELAGFVAGFTRYASPEDLLHYSAAEFSALLRRVYGKVKQRQSGDCLIEFFDSATDRELKRGETMLLAVNDDVPFLYDSCTAEIRTQGHRVLAAFHPVMPCTAADGTIRKQSVIVLALGGMVDAPAAEETQIRINSGLCRCSCCGTRLESQCSADSAKVVPLYCAIRPPFLPLPNSTRTSLFLIG